MPTVKITPEMQETLEHLHHDWTIRLQALPTQSIRAVNGSHDDALKQELAPRERAFYVSIAIQLRELKHGIHYLEPC